MWHRSWSAQPPKERRTVRPTQHNGIIEGGQFLTWPRRHVQLTVSRHPFEDASCIHTRRTGRCIRQMGLTQSLQPFHLADNLREEFTGGLRHTVVHFLLAQKRWSTYWLAGGWVTVDEKDEEQGIIDKSMIVFRKLASVIARSNTSLAIWIKYPFDIVRKLGWFTEMVAGGWRRELMYVLWASFWTKVGGEHDVPPWRALWTESFWLLPWNVLNAVCQTVHDLWA